MLYMIQDCLLRSVNGLILQNKDITFSGTPVRFRDPCTVVTLAVYIMMISVRNYRLDCTKDIQLRLFKQTNITILILYNICNSAHIPA